MLQRGTASAVILALTLVVAACGGSREDSTGDAASESIHTNASDLLRASSGAHASASGSRHASSGGHACGERLR